MKTIMLSAYACAPFSVSEAGAAWMLVEAILRRRRYRVILLTRKKYVSSIEKFVGAHELGECIMIVGVDIPKPLLFWKKGHLGIHIYYYIWQLVAYFLARDICFKQKVDVVHHISFMTIRTNMVAFLGVPSILGPVGGAQLPPPNFSNILLHPVKERVRYLSLILMKYSPFWRLFIKKISVVFLANHENIWLLPKDCDYRVMQIGWPCSDASLSSETYRAESGSINIFWGGRIIGWKGLELLLKAIPGVLSKGHSFHLNITGKGPDEERMRDIVIQNDFERYVTFHGWVSNEMKDELQYAADICVFTSLHETTGTALFEMMEKAKALIVINHAGPGEIVDGDSAILIDVANGVDHAVEQITAALCDFSADQGKRRRFGSNARKRLAEEFGWNAYIDTVCKIYDELSSVE